MFVYPLYTCMCKHEVQTKKHWSKCFCSHVTLTKSRSICEQRKELTANFSTSRTYVSLVNIIADAHEKVNMSKYM